MLFQLVKKHLLVLFLSSLITTYASTALSGKDGMSGGGNAANTVNGVGGELLDFYENKGTKTFNPKETKAYKTVLKQVFDYLKDLSPSVADFLDEGFVGKKWLLEPKVMSEKSCQNQSIIKIKTTIVACQNKHEVRISKAWLQSVNLTQQAGLIMHELLVFHALNDYALNSEENISRKEMESDVRKLNREIFAREFLDEYTLINAVSTTFSNTAKNRKFINKIKYLDITELRKLESLAYTHGRTCEKYNDHKAHNKKITLATLEKVTYAKIQLESIISKIGELHDSLLYPRDFISNSQFIPWRACDKIDLKLIELYQSQQIIK